MTQKQSKDDITYLCNLLTKIEYQTTNAKVRFDNDDYVDIKALSETIVAQLEIMMQYYPSYQAKMNIRKLINGEWGYE